MLVQTKFALGEYVWKAWNGTESYWQPCDFCAATGQIASADGNTIRQCPECYGRRGSKEWRERRWLVDRRLQVGEIRLAVNADTFEERYMCVETGIGSGTLHNADHLFETEDEAQAYCDERNAEERERAGV